MNAIDTSIFNIHDVQHFFEIELESTIFYFYIYLDFKNGIQQPKKPHSTDFHKNVVEFRASS